MVFWLSLSLAESAAILKEAHSSWTMALSRSAPGEDRLREWFPRTGIEAKVREVILRSYQ